MLKRNKIISAIIGILSISSISIGLNIDSIRNNGVDFLNYLKSEGISEKYFGEDKSGIKKLIDNKEMDLIYALSRHWKYMEKQSGMNLEKPTDINWNNLDKANQTTNETNKTTAENVANYTNEWCKNVSKQKIEAFDKANSYKKLKAFKRVCFKGEDFSDKADKESEIKGKKEYVGYNSQEIQRVIKGEDDENTNYKTNLQTNWEKMQDNVSKSLNKPTGTPNWNNLETNTADKPTLAEVADFVHKWCEDKKDNYYTESENTKQNYDTFKEVCFGKENDKS